MHRQRARSSFSISDGFGQFPIAVQLRELETERRLSPVLTRTLVLVTRIVASTISEHRRAKAMTLEAPDLTVPVERREAVPRGPVGSDECAGVGELASTSLARRDRHFIVHLPTLREVRRSLREHLAAVRKAIATLATKLNGLVVAWRP
jgi:hypothetical protein